MICILGDKPAISYSPITATCVRFNLQNTGLWPDGYILSVGVEACSSMSRRKSYAMPNVSGFLKAVITGSLKKTKIKLDL